MKAMKKLIPAICLLLISAVLLGTSTYAWFSMNKTVTATGMQVKATSASSLVITNDTTKLADAKHTIGLTANTTSLTPATHLKNTHKDASGNAITYADGDSYLVHVVNTLDVDPITGLAQGDKTLQYAKSVNPTSGSTGDTYYVDYTVYIAVKGDALTNQNLTAKVTVPDTLQTIYNAISIDFWVDGAYVVTESFADVADAETILSAGAIPSTTAATGNKYITVLMRCYYDGELMNGSNAYVNNGTIDINSVSFSVAFTTADAA